MKKLLVAIVLVLGFSIGSNAQHLGVKTNAIEWATATPNLGIEIGLGKVMSLDISGYYNPFEFRGTRATKMQGQGWGLQSDLRYWFSYKYSGHFLGINGTYGQYDASVPSYTYDYLGKAYGAGLSYGYVFPMSSHWRLELTMGLGWLHYDCEPYKINDSQGSDIEYLDRVTKDIFSPTRIGVNFTYLIF